MFSGIGGFVLASKQILGNTEHQLVEINADAQKMLRRHFLKTPVHDDIRTYEPPNFNYQPGTLICGGFPCSGTSNVGTRAGLDHPESALWWEMLRVIRAARSRFVIVENPTGLLYRGMGTILRFLSQVGYVCEWQTIRGTDVGAPTRRERVFIIAYPYFLWARKKPPCWDDQIRGDLQTIRATYRFPKIERRSDGAAAWVSNGLDDISVGVERYSQPLRLRSRILFGKTVIPACAAVAMLRVKWLDEFFGDGGV